jgi:hypothetical protein
MFEQVCDDMGEYKGARWMPASYATAAAQDGVAVE